MGAFSKGLGYLFRDFSCWTSTHGIPHIGMANAIWLRLFWVIVVIACFVGFLIQLNLLIKKYMAYPVNTETKLEFSDLTFPTVTICHLNPWKADSLDGSPYMTAMLQAYNESTPSADFGFQQGMTGVRQQRAVQLTALANKHLFEMQNSSNYAGYSYGDMVISCTYNAQTCNQTDFQPFPDPNFGMCQQFNLDGSKVSSRAGPLYGLRLVMRTDQNNYLPWTEASGVVVAIHNQADHPFPDVLGFYAPPGTASSMGVSYTETTRLGPPYGTCTSADKVALANYEGKYEVEACFESCLQSEILKKCNCFDPTYPYIQAAGTGATSCFVSPNNQPDYKKSSDNLDCIDSITNSANSTFNPISDCTGCQQPCQVETYAVTVSTAQWPSNGYTPAECSAANQTGQPWMVGQPANIAADEQSCLAWYKINTLLVEVYYERMNYQVLTESAAYTIVNLVSDIGGQVGLFLGMSIISVIEIFTLVFLLFFYCASHRSRRVDDPSQLDENSRGKQRLHNEQSPPTQKQQGKGQSDPHAFYDNGNARDLNPPPVHY